MYLFETMTKDEKITTLEEFNELLPAIKYAASGKVAAVIMLSSTNPFIASLGSHPFVTHAAFTAAAACAAFALLDTVTPTDSQADTTDNAEEEIITPHVKTRDEMKEEFVQLLPAMYAAANAQCAAVILVSSINPHIAAIGGQAQVVGAHDPNEAAKAALTLYEEFLNKNYPVDIADNAEETSDIIHDVNSAGEVDDNDLS